MEEAVATDAEGAGGVEEAGRMGLHALVFESHTDGAFMIWGGLGLRFPSADSQRGLVSGVDDRG